MKFFAATTSLSLLATATAAATDGSCTRPDLVLVEYPTSSVGATPDAAVQKFLTDNGVAQTATLRGRKLHSSSTPVSCMDDGNSGRSWCSTTAVQGGARNLEETVVDLNPVTNTVLAITVDFTISSYNFINVTFAAAQGPLVLEEGEMPTEVGECENELNLVSSVRKEQITSDNYNFQETSTCRVNVNDLSYFMSGVAIDIIDGATDLFEPVVTLFSDGGCPDFNCAASSPFPGDAANVQVTLNLSAIPTRRLLAGKDELVGMIPAEFEPEKYHCESKGSIPATEAQLIHCCLN